MNQAIKWTALVGAAGALLVYRAVKQRVVILHRALTQDDEGLTETLDESFPASDPPSRTATVGAQVAH